MTAPRHILVTGATGFVGGHLLPALAKAFPAARISPAGFDVTDAAAVTARISADPPDACIHLAAIAAVTDANTDPDTTWRTNLSGTLNIGRAILTASPTCRLLFISSGEVYGATFKSGLALDEFAPLAPMNPYAASKAAAEMGLCALAATGLRVIRIRPFNHTGPGQRDSFVVPAFATQIARIEAGLSAPEILVGALSPQRDFLDIRDICAAYTACLHHFDTLPNNDILNIATGTTIPIGEILDTLLSQARCKIAVRQDPTRLRPSEIPRAAGNASRAAAKLGWRPSIPFTETLATVLSSARAGVMA